MVNVEWKERLVSIKIIYHCSPLLVTYTILSVVGKYCNVNHVECGSNPCWWYYQFLPQVCFGKATTTMQCYPPILLTLNILAVDRFDHQFLFLCFSQKFFPATYDKTLCKFLLYTYEDSHNSFWSKILSREHVEYI